MQAKKQKTMEKKPGTRGCSKRMGFQFFCGLKKGKKRKNFGKVATRTQRRDRQQPGGLAM